MRKSGWIDSEWHIRFMSAVSKDDLEHGGDTDGWTYHASSTLSKYTHVHMWAIPQKSLTLWF